ncbi:hypothetical protein PLESTM_001485100 [Pleodorina starrii]|nr:hypothetical protein PLESTM_001485100 [Pleodorina starrii]
MAPKRRAEDEALPPNKERRSGADRPEQLATTLSALNGQFASWAYTNKDRYLHLLWVEGVRDYVRQATELLDEYKDALPADGAAALQQVSADALAQASRRDGPSAAAKAPGAGKKDERAAEFVRDIADLNRQFARWIASNQESHPRLWWMEAARDYLTHATQLLADYSDLLSPSSTTGAGAGAGTGGSGEEAARKTPTQPAVAFGGQSTASTAAVGGFGAFGALGGSAAGSGSGLFGGLAPQREAEAEAKGAAPATGFMAAAATSSAAASGPSLFGSLAPSTAASASGSAPSTTAGAFAFSFGAPTSASAEASAEATASDKSKDAAAPAAPKPFTFLTSSGPAEAAAAEPAAAAAATTASTDAADAAPAASSGGGLFKFGAPPASSAAAAPVTTGFGVVSSDSALPPKPAFTFGAPAASGGAAGGGSTAASAAATTPSFTFGAASASAASGGAAAAGGLAGSIFGGAGGSTAPTFSFGAAPATTATTSSTGGDAAKKDDGAAAAPASGNDTAAAAASAPASGFSFFGAAAGAPAGGAAAAPAVGFSFGGAAGSSAPAFSFAPKPAAAAAADGEGEDNEPEAEPDECAKEPSLKVDDNVDILFREKARLQVPIKGPDGKLNGWEAKGMGMLSVRKAKTEGAKPYMALFTDAGRCLYQAYIYKTMKLVVSEKQKSVAFSAVWSPDGAAPPTMNPALFQLAGAKNRAFEAVVLKLQEEME